jgi:hypothetical protein
VGAAEQDPVSAREHVQFVHQRDGVPVRLPPVRAPEPCPSTP